MRDYRTKHVLSKERRNKLLNMLASRHSHSEINQWAMCKSCQENYQKYKHEKSKLSEQERNELYVEVKRKAKELSQKEIEQLIYPTVNPFA